jgi:hypothetical protein
MLDWRRLVSWYSSTSTRSNRLPICVAKPESLFICPQVEHQVVVIEHALRLLGPRIACEQRRQLFLPANAPREMLLQDGLRRHLGVDCTRLDGEAGPFVGNRLSVLEKPSRCRKGFIESPSPVMDREVGLEADLLGVLHKLGADAWNFPAQMNASVVMLALALAPSIFPQMLSTRRHL